MFGAGDVRIENVPNARLIEPTDALVAVTHAAICGSDLWPYRTLEHSETSSCTPPASSPEPCGLLPAIYGRCGCATTL
jgi:threonine dehydrogenase-like Zn-dependent dehydrogenase